MEIEFFGERLELMAERAIYWRDRATLLVADVHLGKDAAFRGSGIAVPARVGEADLERLTAVLSATAARRLVILGDLLHGRKGMTSATDALALAWRGQHPNLQVLLVRGNHDRSAGDPPPGWGIECVSEPFQEGPFSLFHAPPAPDIVVPALAGHVHPAVTLSGPANSRMSLPCFWMRKRLLVLPAFTEFSGRSPIAATLGDRVFVVGDGQVAEVPCIA